MALDGLAGRTDEIAGEIVAGEPKALVAFTDTVTDLLAAEHKQWLEGTAQAEASLGKLDAQLEQLSKARDKKDVGGQKVDSTSDLPVSRGDSAANSKQ